ncbi:uncharacterized protein MONBRDRAFT_9177 [Monosiga brevicollis MX1]|uniref:BRCT domain-containing protein n=1 Tax=Monosiga brevicollis TaxID=81824 RepID=A9V2B6_MONBE|nr:uncharacterized protein MONBRDRAFT_9177 [Monosiga brevicollis MX1]EDQ88230.1 predicted protein [Monosiga brevicollis MX1]|eukprot:XP_001746823.1 hypothetical protein [Monosiga brevicollis MX1]
MAQQVLAPASRHPLLSLCLLNSSIAASGLTRQEQQDAARIVRMMGGSFAKSLLKTTTHLIVGRNITPIEGCTVSIKQQKAIEHGIRMMSPEWLDAVHRLGQQKVLDIHDSTWGNYRLKPFQDCFICFTSVPIQMRDELRAPPGPRQLRTCYQCLAMARILHRCPSPIQRHTKRYCVKFQNLIAELAWMHPNNNAAILIGPALSASRGLTWLWVEVCIQEALLLDPSCNPWFRTHQPLPMNQLSGGTLFVTHEDDRFSEHVGLVLAAQSWAISPTASSADFLLCSSQQAPHYETSERAISMQWLVDSLEQRTLLDQSAYHTIPLRTTLRLDTITSAQLLLHHGVSVAHGPHSEASAVATPPIPAKDAAAAARIFHGCIISASREAFASGDDLQALVESGAPTSMIAPAHEATKSSVTASSAMVAPTPLGPPPPSGQTLTDTQLDTTISEIVAMTKTAGRFSRFGSKRPSLTPRSDDLPASATDPANEPDDNAAQSTRPEPDHDSVVAPMDELPAKRAKPANLAEALAQARITYGSYASQDEPALIASRTAPNKAVILSTSITEAQKKALVGLAKRLGFRYETSGTYHDACTHLLVGTPCRNEKYLAACAAGRWVLHANEYIAACEQLNGLAYEKDFEWHSHESTYAFESAVWRERVTIHGREGGAFGGWKVVLVSRNHSAFRRVLEAGGARVLATNEDSAPKFRAALRMNPSHVFVEFDEHLMESYASDLRQVSCLVNMEFVAVRLENANADPRDYPVHLPA